MFFKSALFDFDGTMFDTWSAIRKTVFATFVESRVKPPSADRVDGTLHLGATLESTFRALWEGDQKDFIVGHWVTTYRNIYDSGFGAKESVPYPGIELTLENVRQAGGVVVVASNKGEAAISNTLKYHNLDDYVSFVVAARDAQPTKPDPKSFFERIQPRLGSTLPEHVLVVGDTITDISYARAIGAPVCWAAYGYGDQEQCLAECPDFMIRIAIELIQIIGGRGE